jgi:TonB family protein
MRAGERVIYRFTIVLLLFSSHAWSADSDAFGKFLEEALKGVLREVLQGPQCDDSRPKPELGKTIPVDLVCESERAAAYYLDAVVEDNQFKIDKVMDGACAKKKEYGEVTKIISTYAAPREYDQSTMYFSAIAFKDDLEGKRMFGYAFGCGEELPEHKSARLKAEKEARKEKEEARIQEQIRVAEAEKYAERLEAEGLKAIAAKLNLTGTEGPKQKSQVVVDALVTRITQSWRRPVSSKKGLKAIVNLSLASNGQLLDVQISQSSGDVLYDRSVETAVRRAAPFGEVRILDTSTFENEFRRVIIKFKPER